MWKWLGVALLVFGAGAPPASVVVVTAYDFAFKAPDSLAAGVVTLRLVNRGAEAHQLVLMRLDDTTSVERVMRSLVSDKSGTTGVHAASGIESAAPGRSNETSVVLRPGRYIMVCELPSRDGKAHVTKGMLHALTVSSRGMASDTALPAAAATVRLTDYHIELSAPLRPGTRLVRVENEGKYRHHLIVARILHDATLAEIDKWDGVSKPAPIETIGGAAALDPGYASVAALRVTPGRYILACILSSGPANKMHYQLGMETETVVR